MPPHDKPRGVPIQVDNLVVLVPLLLIAAVTNAARSLAELFELIGLIVTWTLRPEKEEEPGPPIRSPL